MNKGKVFIRSSQLNHTCDIRSYFCLNTSLEIRFQFIKEQLTNLQKQIINGSSYNNIYNPQPCKAVTLYKLEAVMQ